MLQGVPFDDDRIGGHIGKNRVVAEARVGCAIGDERHRGENVAALCQGQTFRGRDVELCALGDGLGAEREIERHVDGHDARRLLVGAPFGPTTLA